MRIIKNMLVNRSYHKLVIAHFENSKNVGKFDTNDNNIGTGLVGCSCLWGRNEITNKSC